MSRNYQGEFANQCLTCDYYDVFDTYHDAGKGGYRCGALHYVTPPDDGCYRYEKAYRSNEALEKYFRQLVSWGYTGYYVTSTICAIITSGIALDYLTYQSSKELENQEYVRDDNISELRLKNEEMMRSKANRYINAFKTFYAFFNEYPMGQNFINFYELDGLRMQTIILGNFNNNSEEGLLARDAILDFTFTTIVPLFDSFVTMIEYGNHQGALKKYIQLMNLFAEFVNMNIQTFNPQTGKVEEPLVRTRTYQKSS